MVVLVKCVRTLAHLWFFFIFLLELSSSLIFVLVKKVQNDYVTCGCVAWIAAKAPFGNIQKPLSGGSSHPFAIAFAPKTGLACILSDSLAFLETRFCSKVALHDSKGTKKVMKMKILFENYLSILYFLYVKYNCLSINFDRNYA